MTSIERFKFAATVVAEVSAILLMVSALTYLWVRECQLPHPRPKVERADNDTIWDDNPFLPGGPLWPAIQPTVMP